MSFSHDDHNVKCPFYIKAEPSKIYCEGVCKGGETINVFKDRSHCRDFKIKYCYKLCYGKCPIAIGLNHHYENDT